MYDVERSEKDSTMADDLSNLIHADPDILGGTPVFVGTRVPVQTLLDYLEHGRSLDEFLDHFPSVEHRQAVGVLEVAKELLVARVPAA